MALTGIELPLRRVNPFEGLMIDAAVWRDAHEYHRGLLRLHHQALHGVGIIQGLEVELTGTGTTLLIQPGVALDPAGNFIVVTQPTPYRIESRQAGMVYLIIQFREVLAEPSAYAPGQPTRIVEGFRIQERDRPPDEPYLELGRIQFDPARGPITAPRDPEQPGPNELDRRFRRVLAAGSLPPLLGPGGYAGSLPSEAPLAVPLMPRIAEVPAASTADGATPSAAPSPAPPPPAAGLEAAPAGPAAAASPLRLATGVHTGAGWDAHLPGLRYLAREFATALGRPEQAVEPLAPATAEGIDLLYLTGHAALVLDEAATEGIARLLERGGVVVGDGCLHGPEGEAGMREFALSFATLARRLGCQLAPVERGHALLLSRYVFSAPPPGTQEQARVLEGGGMVLCNADYGCAWMGGSPDRPLSRGTIRDALEFGVNLAVYRAVYRR